MIWWLLPSLAGAALVVAGALCAHTGLVGPMQGFTVSLAGVATLALAVLVLVPLAVAAAVLGKPWAGAAAAGAAFPALAAVLIVALLITAPGGRFNDVTTDPDDPPAIVAGPQAGTAYPDAFRALQADAYPSLSGVVVDGRPDVEFARALALARRMPGWEVVQVDEGARILQAVARSRLFRFPDDVVVRVRPAPGGRSRIDLRSRSRHGRGDLGVNAARIGEFLERFD